MPQEIAVYPVYFTRFRLSRQTCSHRLCVQTMKNVCRFPQYRLKAPKSAIINIEITEGRNPRSTAKGAYRYDKIAHRKTSH